MSDQNDQNISVSKTVDASPEAVFAVLSAPSRHQQFDSADMLRGTDTAAINGAGDEFVMKMNNNTLGDYEMRNVVTEFEPNRKITWAPSLHPLDGYTDKVGGLQATGHTYSWELLPDGDGTKVTQTYDWSGVTDQAFVKTFPLLSQEQLSDSIDKLVQAAKRH